MGSAARTGAGDNISLTVFIRIANGDTMNMKLAAKDNLIGKALAAKTADAALLEQLFLSALSRKPTAAESGPLLKELAATPPEAKRQAWEDVYWSVLSSKEFLFNH